MLVTAGLGCVVLWWLLRETGLAASQPEEERD